jgi:outer membrane protein TolC
VPYVTTAVNPEGKRRSISLAECFALALENGRTGEFFDRSGTGRSTVSGAITAARGNPSGNTDSIRVFSYDPAISAAEIEVALSKFDARWQTAMVWNRVDEPRGLQSALVGQNVLAREQAQFVTQLLKPLPTGGLAGITFSTDYDYSNLNPRFGIPNPSYTPNIQFVFEQPLLQNFGVFINQILERHPGGIRNQIPIGGRVPGILLTRIGADQVQLEYENRIHNLLFVVEQAYWELYCAYWDLYSREMAMRQAHQAWQIAKIRYDTGKIPGQQFAQIAQQYQLFRGQRLQSLGRGTVRTGVLEAERHLRYLIGLPLEDGNRLIPADGPSVAPFVPDWSLALQEALRRRPELIQVRLDIQANQLIVLREKNFRLPDLRFFSEYTINALGDHLDGKDSGSALRNLAENEFNNWELGLRMEIPIGFREANTVVRQEQLRLAQRMAFLRDNEEKVAFTLGRAYRDIFETYENIRIQRERRLETATQLELEYREFASGRGQIDILLEAQRNWADAIRDEHFAICDYNIALVDFERQKGTILERSNVSIMEGPIPPCAEARASAHIRERACSILVKEPLPAVNTLCLPEGAKLVVPDVQSIQPGATVPALLEQEKALPPMPERLPSSTVKPPPPSIQELMNRPFKNDQPATGRPEEGPAKATIIIAPEETGNRKLEPADGPTKAEVSFEPVAQPKPPAPEAVVAPAAVPPGSPAKAKVTLSPVEESRPKVTAPRARVTFTESEPPQGKPGARVTFEEPGPGPAKAKVIMPDSRPEPEPNKPGARVIFEEPGPGPAKASVVIPATRPDPLLPPPEK